jgi:hypothetical protein
MDFGIFYQIGMDLFGQILPEPFIYYTGLISLVISIIITSFLIELVVKKWWWKSGIGFQVINQLHEIQWNKKKGSKGS